LWRDFGRCGAILLAEWMVSAEGEIVAQFVQA